MSPMLNDAFLDSLEHSGSGPKLKKLKTACKDDLKRLVTRLSGIAPNLDWLQVNTSSLRPIVSVPSDHSRVKIYLVSRCQDRSLYPVFGHFPHLRTLLGVRFLDLECEPASKNTEVIQALVAAIPNLKRIDWYHLGTLLGRDSTVIIERSGSHITWSVRHRLREVEGGIYMHWGERGCGNFQL